MIEQILKEIGLNESEKKVYLIMLDVGDSTRGKIVEKSKITGSKIYEVLEKLKSKGLISSYQKNKVKHFKAVNPKQILNYLEEKKKRIQELEEETKNILPKLLSKFNNSEEKQEVEILNGLKGLEIIFREQIESLSKGETCYVIGGTKGSDEENVKDFFEKIHVMREKKKINTKMLFNISQKIETEERYSQKKFANTQIKYIKSSAPVAINIYKNKTAIIIFGKEITSILISSEEVSKSFKEYFDIIWLE